MIHEAPGVKRMHSLTRANRHSTSISQLVSGVLTGAHRRVWARPFKPSGTLARNSAPCESRPGTANMKPRSGVTLASYAVRLFQNGYLKELSLFGANVLAQSITRAKR